MAHPQCTMSGCYRLDDCCKLVLLCNKPKPRELSQKQYKTRNRSSSSFHITSHKNPQPRSGKLAFASFFIKQLCFSKRETFHLCALLWFYFYGMLLTYKLTYFMVANNKKMQLVFVSNALDHRLSKSESMKLDITFLISENLEYILLTTASRTSDSQNWWVKMKKPKSLEQALKSRARLLNWSYIHLTPLHRGSLHENVKGTKINSSNPASKHSSTLAGTTLSS